MPSPAQILAMPLSDFFAEVYLPTFLVGKSAETIYEYGKTVDHWARITGDPPLGAIDGPTMALFKAGLIAGEGAGGENRPARCRYGQQLLFEVDRLGPQQRPRRRRRPLAKRTVNKHLNQLGILLAKLEKPGRGNRGGLGVLDLAPWTEQLKVPKEKPRSLDAHELGRLYAACGTAKLPAAEGIATEDWWRALLVTAYCTGLRRTPLVGVPATKHEPATPGLLWTMMDEDKRVISLPATLDKAGRWRENALHHVALKHLRRIRTTDPRVFPWDMSLQALYRQWWSIQKAAGFPDDEQFGFHVLRKTHGTELGTVGSAFDVQHSLGHANVATSQVYVNSGQNARAVNDRLPMPAAFRGAES